MNDFPQSLSTWSRRVTAAGLGLALSVAASAPASAHPHVWVTVETTVLYENNTVTGFRHTWTFDEFYTAMAIQGLDTNNDGTYSRAELAELAQVNIDGLKEFGFFTFPKLGEQALDLDAPKDFWLEHAVSARPATAPAAPPAPDGAKPQEKPGLISRLGEGLFGGSKPKDPAAEAPVPMLSLHFTVPLKQPVLAEAPDFSFAIYDPSFFIAFDLTKDDPIKLGAGAPSGCRIEKAVEEQQQRLGEAFSQQLGTGVPGYSATRAIKLNCGPRS